MPPLKRISIGGYRVASEAVSGVSPRGRGRKPHKAYRHYSTNGEVPATLRTVVQKVLREARA